MDRQARRLTCNSLVRQLLGCRPLLLCILSCCLGQVVFLPSRLGSLLSDPAAEALISTISSVLTMYWWMASTLQKLAAVDSCSRLAACTLQQPLKLGILVHTLRANADSTAAATGLETARPRNSCTLLCRYEVDRARPSHEHVHRQTEQCAHLTASLARRSFSPTMPLALSTPCSPPLAAFRTAWCCLRGSQVHQWQLWTHTSPCQLPLCKGLVIMMPLAAGTAEA